MDSQNNQFGGQQNGMQMNEQNAQQPNMQYAQQPNAQYAQQPNMQYAQQPNAQYAQQPNAQYVQQPNMQYVQQPNMQYAQQSNMQYTQQPNMQYGQQPNMQYPMNNAPEKKSKAGLIIVGIIAAVIVILGVVLAVLFLGGDKDKDNDNDRDVAAITETTEEPEATEEPEETPEPEETEEPEATPEATEESIAEPVEETPAPVVVSGDAEDGMASFTAYTDEAVEYLVLHSSQWEANSLVYTDTEKFIVLSDQDVRYFMVIGNEVYYSVFDEITETAGLWKCEIAEGATPELLIDGTQVLAFCYVDGNIYFDNYDDEYSFWCYELDTGDYYCVDPDRHALNYYNIHDGYVYYECLNDGCIYKMSLDGSDKEYLFSLSDYGLGGTKCMTAFDVAGTTYLSFIGDDSCMYITTEDGSEYEIVASDLQEFDIHQDIYFEDGCLYYSDMNGTEIHKLGIEEYLTTDMMEMPNEVISYDSFYYFEVKNGLIFIELYDGNNEIRVIDSKTGQEYNIFDFS